MTADNAKALFLTGKVPYYVTGPWFVSDIKKSGVKYAISAFPKIVPGIKSAPFLGVQGLMVTKFSATHGVESLAKDLVATLHGAALPRSSRSRLRMAASRQTRPPARRSRTLT